MRQLKVKATLCIAEEGYWDSNSEFSWDRVSGWPVTDAGEQENQSGYYLTFDSDDEEMNDHRLGISFTEIELMTMLNDIGKFRRGKNSSST